MGKYSNINVSYMMNTATTALNQLSTHESNLEKIYDTLDSDSNFKNSGGVKNAKKKLKDIYTSSSYDGTIKKIEKQLKKFIDGLEYVKKYQEAEKKYKAAEAKASQAKAASSSSSNILDDASYALAKAEAEAIKLEMNHYESSADSKFS